MEELLIFLVVVVLPGLVLVGAVTGVVALVRQRTLARRLEAAERSASIDPGHPVARRLRELERRVAELEASPQRWSPEQADRARETKTAAAPPAATTAAPTVEPQPPRPDDVRRPMPPPRPAPEPPSAPAPTPASAPPAPRGGIDWEQWIGVRGAAAAGGIVLALASLLFFQYSIEHGLISPVMRVCFGAAAGVVCLVGSEWLLRRDQSAAANALAGAGVVILYGATWAAQNLYGLVGPLPAFILMVLITAMCVALAAHRRARFVAVLGLIGGFATPLLVASEMDSPAALFGYILLLDLGLLWIARVRGWPLLSLLSLAATAFHQAIWILSSMGGERALTGITVLAIFALAFLFFSGRDAGASILVRITRAGGVAVPFAFALHFASTAQLAEDPWPLGALLLILSAGALWLESRGETGAATVAAAADAAVIGLWFFQHPVTAGLAWPIVALCIALVWLFTGAAELRRKHDDGHRLAIAAVVCAIGFSAVLTLAVPRCGGFYPGPWMTGWLALGVSLVILARQPGRAWLQLVAGIAPAAGIVIAVDEHGRSIGAPETWLWLALIVSTPLLFHLLAMLPGDRKRRRWAERTAVVTAIIAMSAAGALSTVHHQDGVLILALVSVLAVLAARAATTMRSGIWFFVVALAAAVFETVVCLEAMAGRDTSAALAMVAATAVLLTWWPPVVASAFRDSRAGWWGGALAGAFCFPALAGLWTDRFGDGAIGVLPLSLAAAAAAAAGWARTRLSAADVGRRSMTVWYSAVTVSLVALAVPLQLENEWITIGWALNGLALVVLWVRLDHPGLKLFAVTLLAAATVRLVANPWVLEYHFRSGIPVINWLAYTYLVPAAALVLSLALLRPREIDRLTPWESRLYPVKRPLMASFCGLASVGVVFVWINLAIADYFAVGRQLTLSFERMPARDATTSIAWALYSLVLLAIGVRITSGSLRWLSLGILVLTLGKVFLHDLGELEDLYRVSSLLGLALSLIVVSLIYQRFVFRTRSDTHP